MEVQSQLMTIAAQLAVDTDENSSIKLKTHRDKLLLSRKRN